MEPNFKEELTKFLTEHQLMSLATYGNLPWIATVYYAFDENFNFYFLSNPSSQHCLDIEVNPAVACNVYDSTQTPFFQDEFVKIGMQMHGRAEKLGIGEALKAGLELWKRTLKKEKDIRYLYETISAGKGGWVYKISPKKIKFFHERLFKENNVLEF